MKHTEPSIASLAMDNETLQQSFVELSQAGDVAALQQLAKANGMQLFYDASCYQARSAQDSTPDVAVVARNQVHQYENTCEGVCVYSTTKYYELYR